jgi:CspA family cold shock protein
MAQGKVKWFSKERGYGFISPLDGGKDVFVEEFFVVRNSGIAGAGSRNLEKGERVAYQLSQDGWGATAKNACILKSSRSTDRPEEVVPELPHGKVPVSRSLSLAASTVVA